MSRRLKSLLFSTLYPSSARPRHGLFVETRLRKLLEGGEVEARVIAPVPWFFSKHARYGSYALFARTPEQETWNGIDVLHPRYPTLPGLGMYTAPLAMAAAAIPAARRLIADGFDFDLVDAHYFYPDGVAALILARLFSKPVSITARGSDINLLARYALPRRLMQSTAGAADACVGVCQALVDVLLEWGIDPARLHVMRNGVDLERFHPIAPETAREKLGITGQPALLCVGNLLELKGHHLAVEAVAMLVREFPRIQLVIVGEGPERQRLTDLARSSGVERNVRLVGAVDHSELAWWYSAADALVLASSREGWANVLLESMACGTPVIATRVGGSPEVVASRCAGLLVDRRDGSGLAGTIKQLLKEVPDRGAVRRYAEGFSWTSTSRAQVALFRQLVAGDASPVAGQVR